MKNKIFMIVVSLVVFLSFDGVYANSLIGLKNIEYITNEGVENVKLSFSENIGEVDVKRFDKPDRIIIDFLQAELRLKDTSVSVDSSNIKKVRSGQFMPTTVRVVVDLEKDVKYSVVKDGKYYTISIQNKDDANGLSRLDDKKQESNSKISENKVDKSTENKIENEAEDNQATENKVQNKEDKPIEGKVENKAEDKPVVENKVQNKEDKPIEGKVENKAAIENKVQNKVNKKQNKAFNRVFVEYKKQGEYEVAKIKVNSYKGYNVIKLKNPDRVVIDIPNAYLEEGNNTIKVDGEIIKSIRHDNVTKTSARVILDILKDSVYEILEEKDGLKVLVKKSVKSKDTTPGKISYSISGDRVCLKINKLGFTNNEGKNISNYNEKYDIKNKTYTIIFDKDMANLKDEILKIDDKYLNKIEVINTKHKTKIVFFAKGNFLYEVISREKTEDTVILILKKSAKKKKIVVIDAGHGGKEDPGAVYKLFNEKHMNLDIALRVEECLKKKNISTYMTRKSDVYLSTYERANIANKLNASLFVCIHNNAFTNEEAKGTETLYNPNNSDDNVSISNKKFAVIMQNNMIKALGTVDRGIKERPNIAVLRKTTMPGVLVEVGFLTNPEEFKLLNDGAFRQKAAQAIADSIEEMLRTDN